MSQEMRKLRRNAPPGSIRARLEEEKRNARGISLSPSQRAFHNAVAEKCINMSEEEVMALPEELQTEVKILKESAKNRKIH
jgi:hypothetical protein